MDLDPSQEDILQRTTTDSASASTTVTATRSSARVRAAKEKEQQDRIFPQENKGKAKQPELRRSRRSIAQTLNINEPVTDTKGKKRAILIDSEDEAPSPKRRKTTKRSRGGRNSNNMTKDTKSQDQESSDAAGPSVPQPEADVDMVDAVETSDEQEITQEKERSDTEDNSDPPKAPEEDESSTPAPEAGTSTSAAAEMSFGGGTLLSSDFHYGSYMASLAPKLKTILNNIKPKADPTTRLLALQDLSEVLSMSTEDTLSGSFSTDSYVRELVHILGGPRKNENDDEEEEEKTAAPMDEDAALAAALAMSGGGMGGDNLEEQLLACRCLANLMEALPGSAYTLVHRGAVPVLCGKLLEIQFIDLAEQTISTLEKLSEEYPGPIVQEGGLSALLNYLDFFSTHIQRTALQAAANCCKNLSTENFNMIRDVFPTIRNVLGYSDQRLVEYGCLCVIRIIESFYRSQTTELETLIDVNLITAVNNLLLPPSGSTTIDANTATHFMRALSSASRASPKIALTLLEAGIADTLYAFLTGVLPSASKTNNDQGSGENGQGFGGGLADMAVMQNLAHRPKEQVEEALSLISELMPPLPRDGVFDARNYTERMLHRAAKAKLKEARKSLPDLTENGTGANKASSDEDGEGDEIIIPTVSNDPMDITTEGDNEATPVEQLSQEIEEQLAVAEQTTQEETEAVVASPVLLAVDADVFEHDFVMDISHVAEPVQETTALEAPSAFAQETILDSEPGPVPTSQEPPTESMEAEMAAPAAEQVAPPAETNSGEAVMDPVATEGGSTEEPAPAQEAPDAVEDAAPQASSSESRRRRANRSSSTSDREKILRENKEVVARFIYLIVPVLFDVYSASVTLQVRLRSFNGILKATNFVEDDQIPILFMNVPVASFIGSILSSKDNPTLVSNALQLVELLLLKSPNNFRQPLRKEGVLHEVAQISKTELKSKQNQTQASEEVDQQSQPPPPKKPSSHVPSDPQDQYVLRSQVIKVKYLSGAADAEGDATFDALKSLIETLSQKDATVEASRQVLGDIAMMFSTPHSSISSFELLKSGLVDGLLAFTTDTTRTLDIEQRENLFLDAFSSRSGYLSPSSQTPLSILVKRLQESLTRMESYDVVSTSPGSYDDARRSSLTLISRTLRIKLVAEDPADVPRSCQTIGVSIHAIAPFTALEDYLKPRIAGLTIIRSDQIPSGLLQALSASGAPSSAFAHSLLSRLGGISPSASSPPGAPGGLGSLLNALAGLNGPHDGRSTDNASTSTSSAPQPKKRGSKSKPTTEPPSVSRRRSLRLKGQPPTGEESLADASAAAPEAEEQPLASAAPPTESRESSLEGDLFQRLVDDLSEPSGTIEAEVGEDSDADDLQADRTINLSIDAESGMNTPVVRAKDAGTVTPTTAVATSSSVPRPGSSASRPSYAAAAHGAVDKATDFYLEFRLEGTVIPTEMTIYGALHQFEAAKTPDGPLNTGNIWHGNYTIKYRKIPGKKPSDQPRSDDSTDGSLVAGLPVDSPASQILRLLKVLHRLNSEGIEHIDVAKKIVTIPDSAFVNNKLTAKLGRQLEEIMVLASNCLPQWAMDLPQAFGFLFPFSTRYQFLQSTSFGYARLLNRVIAQATRDGSNNSNRRDGLDQYGRLQRRKIEVPRNHSLEVALKLFELFGTSSAVLDVHFQGEVGTGLGPTLEFYASVCRDFARRDLKLWRDTDSTLPGKYVHHPFGLFPAPILDEGSDDAKRKLRLYKLLGQFIARSLLDSRVIDISLNKIFLKLILDQPVLASIASVKIVDATLAQSLTKLEEFVQAKKAIIADIQLTNAQRDSALDQLAINGVKLEDLCLDFTVPGFEEMSLKKPLREDENTDAVTSANVEEYITLAIDAIVGKGVEPAVRAFKDGFSTVFPVSNLKTFSIEELVMMFGNADEDWSPDTLGEAIKADHGFNVESKAIKDLIQIMASYDKNGRRDFLQFITGSPKLPIGGFRALQPALTVVRKPFEAPLTSDDYLPSVMTCAHYLKLPDYSSRDLMAQKLQTAMREGVGSFYLS